MGAYQVDLADAAAAGGVAAILNPEGVDLFITRLILDVTTIATAAATVDAGVAANGTTSADNLIDGLDVHSATGAFDNVVNPGSNGKGGKRWAAGEYITISKASGAVTGLVGSAFVQWVRLE